MGGPVVMKGRNMKHERFSWYITSIQVGTLLVKTNFFSFTSQFNQEFYLIIRRNFLLNCCVW